jgi:hypothetical protein
MLVNGMADRDCLRYYTNDVERAPNPMRRCGGAEDGRIIRHVHPTSPNPGLRCPNPHRPLDHRLSLHRPSPPKAASGSSLLRRSTLSPPGSLLYRATTRHRPGPSQSLDPRLRCHQDRQRARREGCREEAESRAGRGKTRHQAWTVMCCLFRDTGRGLMSGQTGWGGRR